MTKLKMALQINFEDLLMHEEVVVPAIPIISVSDISLSVFKRRSLPLNNEDYL